MLRSLRHLCGLILKGPGLRAPKVAPLAEEETRSAWGAIDFYTVQAGEWIAFPMRTADSRQWRVQVDWSALEALSGRTEMTSEELDRILQANVHHLEVAALRAIGRNEHRDDIISLNTASLDLEHRALRS